jgi:hypothetical protein
MGEHDRMDQKWYEPLRCPVSRSPWLWYGTLGVGAFGACVALGALLGTVLGAWHWFR